MRSTIDQTLLPAREAAGRLGVKLDTLYAYVSRGLLCSVEVAGSRERHYDADEVERFRTSRGAVRNGEPRATLIPVIDSAICLIEGGRFYYRGVDALRLADTATLEEVAALLWSDGQGKEKSSLAPTGGEGWGEGAATGSNPGPATLTRLAANTAIQPLPRCGRGEKSSLAPIGGEGSDEGAAAGPSLAQRPSSARPRRELWEGERQAGLIEQTQTRLAALSATDLAALDLTHTGVVRTGRAILADLAACVGRMEASEHPIHQQLAASWHLDDAGTDLVRRCLVLLADHELNASAFVARCVASTGATPYAVVSAALAALSGRRHGGASARAEALFHELAGFHELGFHELASGAEPIATMAARLARDESLPGMGQPLYPDGDPRGAAILAAAKAAVPARAMWIDRVAAAATQLTGQYPNVDFGLAAAATVLGLPRGAALGLFLVARSVGWIAHAIEQYESPVLIRPRARYTGRRPAAPG